MKGTTYSATAAIFGSRRRSRPRSTRPAPNRSRAGQAPHRVGDRVRLHRVEDQPNERIRQTENTRRAGQCPSRGDVEGRAAAIDAGRPAHGSCARAGRASIRMGGRHPDQRDHPHPEDRAGTAQIERHRDAGDIAGPDPVARLVQSARKGGCPCYRWPARAAPAGTFREAPVCWKRNRTVKISRPPAKP